MKPRLPRCLGWLLLAALLCSYWFKTRHLPPKPAPAGPPPLVSVSLTTASPAPTADAEKIWNGWRAQLPTSQPTIQDATEWPGNRTEPFDQFRAWQAQYRAAGNPTSLEAAGVALAKARRAAMARWIERDPEFALAQAVGPDTRRELPAAVLAELEATVAVAVAVVAAPPPTPEPLPAVLAELEASVSSF